MSRILILANNDIGLYKFRKELIKELLNDHEVFISLPDGPFVEKLVHMGCVFIDTEINRRGTNPITDLKLLLTYRKMLRKTEPDAVLTYTIKPNVYGGVACRFLNIPYIANITGLGTAIESSNYLRSMIIGLYKFSLGKAGKVFFQNIENLSFFKTNEIVKEEQIELIPGSGVNLNQYRYLEYPKNNNQLDFIYIGRLMKEKGITELFEAAKFFKNKLTEINFHVVGFLDDNLEEELQQLIKEEIIIYHGPQSDVRPFLEKSHAIIHPSYHEGLSNVLLEAAASGRPIIASEIPGCRETFDEGITGLGFNPKSTESLIESIQKFIDLPNEEKEKMGILGRKKIEREFDREQVVDAYIKEINNIKQ